jgi:hypothetical protein
VTERELRRLLDAKPDPAEAERLLAGVPESEAREIRALLAIGRAAASLPGPAPRDDFHERTMERIRAQRPPRRSLGAWLVAPRLSPLGALAGAAAAAFLAVAVARYPSPAPAGPSDGGRVVARLALAAPHAREVRVAGDFNRWRPETTPLRRGVDGVWTVELPLEPGRRYEYMFVVDGAWTTDPSAAVRADDGFGGENAVLDI